MNHLGTVAIAAVTTIAVVAIGNRIKFTRKLMATDATMAAK
jgi:hypothetical protein